jgi:hypothetical protein
MGRIVYHPPDPPTQGVTHALLCIRNVVTDTCHQKNLCVTLLAGAAVTL